MLREIERRVLAPTFDVPPYVRIARAVGYPNPISLNRILTRAYGLWLWLPASKHPQSRRGGVHRFP